MAGRYEMDMCNGPLLGKIFRFTVPLILSGILQLFFNAADIVIVGRFAADGNTAIAAVGSTGSLINLIVTLLMGLSVGASVVVSRGVGAKNEKEISNAVHTAVSVAAIGGILLGVFGFFCSGTFLRMMDSPERVLPLASLYMRIYFVGLPAMMLYNFGASILRAVGDTRRPMIYLAISGVINVALNAVFVIVFSMDVAGVALATVISQVISCILVLRCLIVDRGAIRLEWRRLRIYRREFSIILRVGLPAGIQGSLFAISNVLIQSSINGFGEIVMAGNAAAGNIDGFVYVAMNSFSQTAITFTAQNVGAGKLDRVRKVAWLTTVMVTAIGAMLGGFAYLFGETLLGIYRPGETEAIAAGLVRMVYVTLPYFLCGIMEVFVGLIRGMGRSIMPMIVSLCGVCGVRIVWIYTVFAAHPTPEVLYLSYPITWVITTTVHFICLIYTYKKLKRALSP